MLAARHDDDNLCETELFEREPFDHLTVFR